MGRRSMTDTLLLVDDETDLEDLVRSMATWPLLATR